MTYKLLLALLLYMLAPDSLLAQSPYDPAYGDVAEQIREDLNIFCDRSIYAVEEGISFLAELRMKGSAPEDPWSSILYVELISADGKAIVQEKYRISEGQVHASLEVPAGALTGEYLLKAYTRWMRNHGPDSFSYTPLKIINPFMKELSSPSNGNTGHKRPARVQYRKGILACSTTTSEYAAGEEMLMHISVEEQFMHQTMACCVTVVPEGAIDLSNGSIQEAVGVDNPEPFRVSYMPDLGQGLSLSGSVVDSEQHPVPFTTLHFSLLGDNPDYYAAISDASGRFNMAGNWGEGNVELFVTPGKQDAKNLEVRIDQDYDSRPGHLPLAEFRLTEEEREQARKLALNMQLSRAFRTTEISGTTTETDVGIYSGMKIPFYGTGVKQLLIDDYVRLPNLEEVFINLIPEVQLNKKKGRTEIRILSENSSIGVYKPLIMIDNISVFDEEAILALLPEKIERIDLINDVYLKGSTVFGGVLAIYSRNGDMAGIDLPEGSYFFDLQGISTLAEESAVLPQAGSRIPDTRNTIYWNDEVAVDREHPADLSFRAPAAPGSYVILVRAVSPDGEVLSASSQFTVE